jgi:transposase
VILEAIKKELNALKDSLSERDAKIKNLQEENSLLRMKLFGKKSERRHFDAEAAEQSSLFNEAENTVFEELKSPELYFEPESESEKGKSGGRRPLPAILPRITEDILPPENKLKCRHCNSDLKKIGEEVTEKLEVEPAKYYIRKYVRSKYKCTCCETEPAEIIIAPLPKTILPKATPGAGFMAHVAAGKFADRIPFYHLSKILARSGIDISRGNMSRWIIDIYENHLVNPMEKLMEELFRNDYLQCDETRLQVLQKDGLQYMWVIHGKLDNVKVAFFHYQPSRSAKFLKENLKNFKGVFQTDGWGSYETHLGPMPNVIHAGCNVHARRKFTESDPSPEVDFVIEHYRKIYKIESDLEKANAPPDIILKIRREKSLPIFELLRDKMNEWALAFRPAGNFGKAVKYFMNEYDKLIVFIDHPQVRPDTNLVENNIRPFAVGRKNWLFSGNEAGASASAAFYTLVQTANLNGWDPYQFLLDLFNAIEKTDLDIDLVAFLRDYKLPAVP